MLAITPPIYDFYNKKLEKLHSHTNKSVVNYSSVSNKLESPYKPLREMKNDQLFWQKLVQGDKKVVEEIFQLNVPVLFKYGRRFSDDDRVIDECILHVFLDIWKNRLHLKEGQKEEGQIKLFLMKKLRQKLESKEQGTQLRRA